VTPTLAVPIDQLEPSWAGDANIYHKKIESLHTLHMQPGVLVFAHACYLIADPLALKEITEERRVCVTVLHEQDMSVTKIRG
jgi:hypothetical protein